MSNNEDKMIHPKRLTKADIAKIKASLPKRMDLGQPRDIEEILVENKDEVCVPLSAETILSFRKYAEMLKEKNKVMNLTSITDDEGIALKHFIDSLTIASYVDEEQSKIKGRKVSLIDVGTGAGFPGVVLKIVFPNLKITLVDSLQKRVNYLNEIIKELKLQDIEAIHSRGEDYKGEFDVVTSRAVANIEKLVDYTMHLVSKNGVFVAMKGNIDKELTESVAKKINKKYRIIKLEKFTLPIENSERSLVVIKKA